jgi:hypothetical protein
MFVIIIAAGLLGFGCNKDNATAGQGSAAPAATSADLQGLFDSYERIRAALARDNSTPVASAAAELAAAAARSLPSASATLRPHIEGVQKEAEGLKSNAGELSAARTKFGELSRHVVALVRSDPALERGRFVFECPMASGYKKWVQTSDKIENPYMGQEMLACGAASSWAP